MSLRLVPLVGGPNIPLEKDVLVVGRRQGCDIRLDHKSVSKYHCILARSGKQILLRDLGSTNGTRVNGARIRRAVLNESDRLTIANFAFRVENAPEASVDLGDRDRATHHIVVAEPRAQAVAAPELLLQVNALPDEYSPVEDDQPGESMDD